MKFSKCVVFLADKYACGVDIKFETPNATVIVLREVPKPRHIIRQMFGRGMRDHTTNSGMLFTKGVADGADGVANRLMQEDSNPF